MANRKPLAQRAAEGILDYIRTNDMKPGDRLPTEQELTQLLEVGRGTVREAVQSLASRNILEVRQGAGTFLSDKNGIMEDPLGLSLEPESQKMALDMMDVRLMIEPEIAFKAALHATPEQVQPLLDQCSRVEKLIKANKPYREEDALFHKLIGECTGNLVVSRLVPLVTSSVVLNVDVTRDRYRDQTVICHRQVAQAVARHDPETARRAMIMHLHILRSGISDDMTTPLND